MEFFDEITTSTVVDTEILKELLLIKNLPILCKSITSVIKDNISDGTIYCIWGEFKINREELKYGVRFSMPDCPNALAWSITTDSHTNIIIHCTINKKEHDKDFIESIYEFINTWTYGLKHWIDLNQHKIAAF